MGDAKPIVIGDAEYGHLLGFIEHLSPGDTEHGHFLAKQVPSPGHQVRHGVTIGVTKGEYPDIPFLFVCKRGQELFGYPVSVNGGFNFFVCGH
jgi:hypothetical protein